MATTYEFQQEELSCCPYSVLAPRRYRDCSCSLTMLTSDIRLPSSPAKYRRTLVRVTAEAKDRQARTGQSCEWGVFGVTASGRLACSICAAYGDNGPTHENPGERLLLRVACASADSAQSRGDAQRDHGSREHRFSVAVADTRSFLMVRARRSAGRQRVIFWFNVSSY